MMDKNAREDLNVKRLFFFIFLFVISSIFLIACDEAVQETEDTNDYEGMEVQLDILENFEAENNSLIKMTVLNNADKTFNGTANVKMGFESWEIEVVDLSPGNEMEKQFRHKYIKHPEDGYRYSFDGDLTDNTFSSSIDYKIIEVSSNAYEVQMDNLDKENVFEVMNEIYSQYGSKILHVGFFDNSVDLENKDVNVEFPKAEYWGKPDDERRITIGSEEYDFQP